MTCDPDRDARAPADVSRKDRPPNKRPYERDGMGLSVALMLALMAAFVAVGFWFYATQASTTLIGTGPAVERTTGAGAQEPPLPNTPTPPTAPSPQRQ